MAINPGFTPATLAFLRELAANNERPWFEANRQRYEAQVREPSLALIEAMGSRLTRFAPQFRAVAKKTGGSLMRVHRDTRFSADKTPYKTNIGIQFRHALGKDVHAPGYYLHVDPAGSFLGVGIWRPDAKALGRIREFLLDNPEGWRQALAHRPFARHFELAGDSLKRAPRGMDSNHPLLADLKRKDFIAVHDLPADRALGPQLVDLLEARFEAASPFMRYLCAALEIPY